MAVIDNRLSVTGRRWQSRTETLHEADIEAIAMRLSLDYGVPDRFSRIMARVVSGRHIAAEGLKDYLKPTLKSLFPNPLSFKDMDCLVEAIIQAIIGQKQIYIFSDYDVDGATAGALMVRWLRAVGANPEIYVPDRMTEGYGPTPLAFDRLKNLGAQLVITLDCGASAHKALEHAASLGLDVVVIDHHLMREDPPACLAVVNPNRPDCQSGQGNLCAAGVVFVALAALNRELETRGYFKSLKKPDLLQWLDLAALGAICDVTALTGFNRAMTTQGLKVMSSRQNLGIAALLDIAQVGNASSSSSLLDVFHSGFIIGPRINAGGRVGQSDLGLRLLVSEDESEVLGLAHELNELNAQRRDIEAELTEAAKTQITKRFIGQDATLAELPALVVYDTQWHPGVIGIVASRLREIYRKPVIVIGIDPVSGIGKGSGRSQAGINLGQIIGAAFDDGLLIAGGGHAMAAGLTIHEEKIEAFEDFLCQSIRNQGGLPPEPLEYDSLLSVSACERMLLDVLDAAAPFGPGNPEPIFVLDHVLVSYHSVLKGDHLRLEIMDSNAKKLKAIAWRSANTNIGKALMGPGPFHISGRLKRDDYMGRNTVQFEIEDVMSLRAHP